MGEYGELRAAVLAKPVSVIIKGVALEVSADHPFRRSDLLPFNPCVCVTEPCPCDGYDHGNGQEVVWYSSADVIATRDTGLRTAKGDDLVEIELAPDAIVLIESVRRVTAFSYAANDRGKAVTTKIQ